MTLRVVNPATGKIVGEVPSFSRAEVHAAVARARAAQPAWAERPMAERVGHLRAFQQALVDAREEVARVVTSETGKPFVEALGVDVLSALDSIQWATRHGPRVLRAEKVKLSNPLFLGRVSHIEHAPLGVVGIISPWNYPLGIPCGNVVYALLSGNTVVLKPASFTPFTALKMREVMTRAGIPDDVCIVTPGSGKEAGQALIDADIDHLVFTGSVPVGRDVDRQLTARGIGSTMELGGSDPAIVLADAPDHAARGVVWGRFTNAGQTCAAVKRVFVERAIYDRFVAEVVQRASALRLGDPSDPKTEIGALTDPRSVQDMEDFVADAKKRGGRVLCGGRARPDLAGQFFEPTVIVDLPADARLLTEECFGPILPIVPFDDVEEAIRQANASRFGLCASVWTKDPAKGEAIARRLNVGTAIVNDAAYTFAANETPWGGIKESGHGRTHGPIGLLEMTRTRHVNLVPARLPSVWWFPYGTQLRDTFMAGAQFLYGKSSDKARVGAGLTANLMRRLRK
ncbi:MAG TPA: aldehyde dehydrogenase family protein [Candidatus Thermoplasmatota archaeon]|nr:aldehyde dehydrogenase family protein [Candidatus Thermoplasmatota archaeon]